MLCDLIYFILSIIDYCCLSCCCLSIAFNCSCQLLLICYCRVIVFSYCSLVIAFFLFGFWLSISSYCYIVVDLLLVIPYLLFISKHV